MFTSIALVSSFANAATCVVNSTVISSNCSDLAINAAVSTTINSNVIVSGVNATPVNVSASNATLTNFGVINSAAASTGLINTGSSNVFLNAAGSSIYGIYQSFFNIGGSSLSLTNAGSILATGSQDPGKDNSGIVNTAGGSFDSLTNNSTGTISGLNDGILNLATINVISNYGTISGAGNNPVSIGIENRPNSFIGSITNYQNGTISGGLFGIYSEGNITNFQNSGTLTGGGVWGAGFYTQTGVVTNFVNSANGLITGPTGVIASGNITNFNNAGNIVGDGGEGLYVGLKGVNVTIATLTNTGTISGSTYNYGIRVLQNPGTVTSIGAFTNSGSASISGGLGGIDTAGIIGTLNNSASIAGVYNESTGTITSFINSGSITGLPNAAGIDNEGTITTFTNTGSIAGSTTLYGIVNRAGGTIGILTNSGSGSISGVWVGIDNTGIITTLTNSGSIAASSYGIENRAGGTITSFINSGSITGLPNAAGIDNSGTITTLTNNLTGTITGGRGGISNEAGATITNIVNAGTISTNNDHLFPAADNYGVIGTLSNTGVISAVGSTTAGFYNEGAAVISTINNSGVISGGLNGYGIYNDSYQGAGKITSLTNTGAIYAGVGGYGIYNLGTITILNNAQGGNRSSTATTALTYAGALPTNYNIIINSPTSYGQLAYTAVKGGGGLTTFGIYAGSIIRNGTYASVLTGITWNSNTLNNTTGTYGSATWLLSNTSSDIWDLIISGYYSGPSVANTNQSLVNTASALQGTYTLQNSVLANSFSYDCTVFGANDVCVSAGGRNTQVQAANGLNNTSALLIAAYRPHPNYRIGAYADQNLSVSNPGGTVNLGNNTPLLGLFGAWNERLDGTGTEVKVSAAYGQKNTTINRSVVGSGTGASEAGSGSSTLNSQGAQATVKYGFSVLPEVIVSPYVGVRYTQNNMGGYTEGASSSVTAPLTYSALNTNATTALAGVGASYRVIPTVMTFASAGVEIDTNTANGTYSATNASIGTLTPVNFNANPIKTRPTATVGAYYDIEKNQRLGITGIYRQEAYQAVSTTTVLATYTIGL
ncbi:autotransporter outer membrane beta-barrel domain-containing protein [Polynucleobacter paneuropaeus]|nr:autotransporter outer membrane beta-barrel domain-containing protein [Polynucleobacter paneuropaeus]